MEGLTVKIINSLDFGGIEKVFEIYAKYYPGNKQNVLFVSLGAGGVAARYLNALGFRVVILDRKTRIPNIKLISALYRLLKREKAGVVHTCGAEGNFHGLIAAWIARIPIRVGEEIGIPSHSKIAQLIFRFVYSRATGMIAVSPAVREYLIEKKEVAGSKVKVIYNPVDIEKFQHVDRLPSADDFVLLAVCRLTPIKNLSALIEVFAVLVTSYSHLKLWIVGDGPEMNRLQNQVDALQIKERVIFFGYQNEPALYLSKANVFILPSFSEGHPVSMVEAMIMGVPVIVTQVGGGSDIVDHGKNGWLIDPNDVGNIEAVLRHVIQLSNEEREAVGKEAQSFAAERFSPSRYFSELTKCLYGN